MIDIQIYIKNIYGEFIGEKLSLDEDGLKLLTQKSSKFFNDDGFEMWTEDGCFMVFPPEIIKQSILIIKKSKDEN